MNDDVKQIILDMKKKHNLAHILLKNIKKNMPLLEELLQKSSDHWNYEDKVYRYYHKSFKVYYIQDLTLEIVNLLNKISPHKKSLNEDFNDILKEGIFQKWNPQHNREWNKRRPILEAFFHARFFLEMAVKYGKELDKAPEVLPSGWAALLHLYNIR